jgi:hypothetical protein
MNVYGGSGWIEPPTLTSKWRWVVGQFHALAVLTPGKDSRPFTNGIDGCMVNRSVLDDVE